MPKAHRSERKRLAAKYQQRLKDGLEDGNYVYRYRQQRGPTGARTNGYCVYISYLGAGYSKWFGANAYGGLAGAKHAAILYREFAIDHLPDLFPSKDKFIKWLMRRGKRV